MSSPGTRRATCAALLVVASIAAGTIVAPAVAVETPPPVAIEPEPDFDPATEKTPATPTTEPAAVIAALPPLYAKRAGVSREEPDFCRPTLTVEKPNPNAMLARSLQIGPPRYMVEGVEGGSAYRGCFFLFNRQAERRRFLIETLDITGSLNPDITVVTSTTPVVAGSWIHPVVTAIEVEPGGRVIIPYAIRYPETPPAGTSIAGIRIIDATSAQGGGGAAIRRSAVMQVQTTFPGGEFLDLKVSGLSSPRFLFKQRKQDRFDVDYVISNRGTIVDIAETRLVVDGLFGREVARIKDAQEVLLPISAQRKELEWRGIPWIGRYSPRLEITSGNGSRTVDLPTLWIVPPWPYLAAVAVALAIAAFGIHRRRQRYGWRAYLDDVDDDDGADEGWSYDRDVLHDR